MPAAAISRWALEGEIVVAGVSAAVDEKCSLARYTGSQGQPLTCVT